MYQDLAAGGTGASRSKTRTWAPVARWGWLPWYPPPPGNRRPGPGFAPDRARPSGCQILVHVPSWAMTGGVMFPKLRNFRTIAGVSIPGRSIHDPIPQPLCDEERCYGSEREEVWAVDAAAGHRRAGDFDGGVRLEWKLPDGHADPDRKCERDNAGCLHRGLGGDRREGIEHFPEAAGWRSGRDGVHGAFAGAHDQPGAT